LEISTADCFTQGVVFATLRIEILLTVILVGVGAVLVDSPFVERNISVIFEEQDYHEQYGQ
jgi:hypothetical protein